MLKVVIGVPGWSCNFIKTLFANCEYAARPIIKIMQNYQVLTLKYRPQNLSEIWIQEHIKTTLTKAIENNRVAHAYLFTGPRGVGKTTTARILAKSLNCKTGPTKQPCQQCSVCREITNSQNMDVLEIDGASNRGIDQVRELRENVKFLPTSCPYKIYIIDEVHMLTQEAFNALLKTLEEPPPHVKFIFATTAPQKVPATILSRCQRFDFRKATNEEISKRLEWIGAKENIQISEDALHAIAKRADGSIRDAEGMLDQLRVFKSDNIELGDVEDLLGLISDDVFFEYTDDLLHKEHKVIVQFIDKIFSTSLDFNEFFSGLLKHFRMLLLVKLNISKPILGVSDHYFQKYDKQSVKFEINELLIIMQQIADNEEIIKRTTEPKILFEILSLNLINLLSRQKTTDPIVNRPDNDSNQDLAWRKILIELTQGKPYFAAHLQTASFRQVDNNVLEITVFSKIAEETITNEIDTIEKKLNQHQKDKIKIKVTCLDKNKSSEDSKTDTTNKTIEELERSTNDADKIFKEVFPKGKKLQ